MLKKFLNALPTVVRDVSGVVGAALVAYGAWRVYAPAGFIVGGLLLLVGSVLAARADVGD